jgi:hypothetical protein
MGVVSNTPLPRFAPGKVPPVLIVQEAGWASEPAWTQRLEEKSFASAGDRTPIARSYGSGQGPVAGCCECGDEPSGSGATEFS